jgi:hypothetical protein
MTNASLTTAGAMGNRFLSFLFGLGAIIEFLVVVSDLGNNSLPNL